MKMIRKHRRQGKPGLRCRATRLQPEALNPATKRGMNSLEISAEKFAMLLESFTRRFNLFQGCPLYQRLKHEPSAPILSVAFICLIASDQDELAPILVLEEALSLVLACGFNGHRKLHETRAPLSFEIARALDSDI